MLVIWRKCLEISELGNYSVHPWSRVDPAFPTNLRPPTSAHQHPPLPPLNTIHEMSTRTGNSVSYLTHQVIPVKGEIILLR